MKWITITTNSPMKNGIFVISLFFDFFKNSVSDSERIFLDFEFWFFLSPIEVFTIDCLESVEICYGLVISDFIVFRIIEVPYSDRVRKGLRVIDLRFRLTSNRMKTQQLCCIFCTGRCTVKFGSKDFEIMKSTCA